MNNIATALQPFAYLLAATVSLALSSSTVADETSDSAQFTFVLLGESKYVSEGRDNIETGDLYSIESTCDLDNLTIGIWLAEANHSDYKERNLSITYSEQAFGGDWYAGYTRLDFPEDNSSDDELSAGLAFNHGDWLTSSADYVYSKEASGSFLELSLSANIPNNNEQLDLSIFITQSFDFGFATPEHDGANNLLAGIEFAYKISPNVELNAYLSHSWAQQDVKRDNLGDISWAGVGLSLAL